MRRGSWHALDQVAYGILVFVIFVAPFPVASNRIVGISVTSTLLILAMVMAQAARAFSPTLAERHPLSKFTQGWLALLGGVVGWIWLSPLLVHYPALDPLRYQVYQVQALAYLAVGSLVMLTIRNKQRLLALLISIIISATAEALIAVLVLSANTDFSLMGVWFPKLHRAQGTFANPDHFANYLAMSIALAVGVMLATGNDMRTHRRSWQSHLLATLQFLMSSRMLVRLAIVVMVIGLVLSRSRMGNASFFLALLLLLVGIAMAWPGKRRAALWLGASLLVIDLVVIGQWVGLEHVVERLQGTELRLAHREEATLGNEAYREETLQERLAIGADAFKLALQSPWAGNGPATFFTLFPQVKRPSFDVWLDHAHNDYAEIAADLGIPALIGLGGVVCMALLKSAQLMRNSNVTTVKGVASGTGMAIFCMLMHAWVDFNLHIHANAMLFMVTLSLPLAVADHSKYLRASA